MSEDQNTADGKELSALRDGFRDAERTLAELADRLEGAAKAENHSRESAESLEAASEAVAHLAKALQDHVVAAAAACNSMTELTDASKAAVEAVDPVQLRTEIDAIREELEQLGPKLDAAVKVQVEVAELKREVQLLTKMLPDRWRRRAE